MTKTQGKPCDSSKKLVGDDGSIKVSCDRKFGHRGDHKMTYGLSTEIRWFEW